MTQEIYDLYIANTNLLVIPVVEMFSKLMSSNSPYRPFEFVISPHNHFADISFEKDGSDLYLCLQIKSDNEQNWGIIQNGDVVLNDASAEEVFNWFIRE